MFLRAVWNNRFNKFVWAVFFVLIGLFLFQGCSTQQNDVQKEFVVCTTNIIADVVRVVLPEDVQVISLMGEGVDPHLYKAGYKDLEHLQQAKVIVENGLHLEGKMAEVLEKLTKYKTVVKMSDGLDEAWLINLDDNIYDPHIWFDVDLWGMAVFHVSEQLASAYPQYAEKIAAKEKAYQLELDELNNWVANQMEKIPKQKRVLVSAHDAFSYFGRAYKIEVRGLQGISTQSEFGLKDVSDLVNYLVERKIPAVFVETSVSEKSIRAVVEGCENRGHKIRVGGKLYSDALGGKGEAGNTYINMVESNVTTIYNALNSQGNE